MKTVILPTDFSANSKHAIDWALNFYKYENANFVILNTYKTPRTSASSIVSLSDILHKQSIEDLANYKQELYREFPDLADRITTKTFFGDVLLAVNTLITEEDDEVRVVVGAKGMTAVKELLVGSNTSDLILNLKVPLYVIPENFNHKGFKEIALGVDYRGNINKEVLNPLRAILEQTSAKLYPFNVENDDVKDEQKEAVLNELRAYFKLPNLHIAAIKSENSLDGIKDFIKRNDIDCLVSVNRHKSFFERIFHKSFSKELAENTNVAMLILHD